MRAPRRPCYALAPGIGAIAMSRASVALDTLRGYVIAMVVTFHSVMAYMASAPSSAASFDTPPYAWRVHPIVDAARFWGFDLFGAFQFLHLMQLMFFLSGVFVWPSLVRKGAAVFLRDRVFRLGVPFCIGVFLLMPAAYFPAYRVGALDPSWHAYWTHWTDLPFWPNGPMWFLWYVLLLNVAAAGIFCFAPGATALLGRLSDHAGRRPERLFIGLVLVSTLLDLPLAKAFAPWDWVSFGPFEIQASVAPQYALYFLTGLAVGAGGIGRGALRHDGPLAQHWAAWLAGALTAFGLWLACATLIETGRMGVASPAGIARELGFTLFAASACLAAVALFLHFATAPRPIVRSIAENSYGIYLFHYVFVLWMQYALLPVALPAVVKGAIVLGVALALSWAASAAVGRVAIGARLMRGERRIAMARQS